jgi:hypothetical protein
VYNRTVPNQRSPGQKLIAFPLDEDLLAELDRARGHMNRSQFIREALAAKLGVQSSDIIAPPDRAGKGGPKAARKQAKKPGTKNVP